MKKIERINRVENTLTESELRRRLPEVDLIVDDEIRRGVIRAFLLGCPDHFWERPASVTGKFHPPDEAEDMGNWLHVKRVFTTYLALSRTYREQGLISEREREAGKGAALLHDMLKFGWPSEDEGRVVDDHDIIGAEVAKVLGELPRSVYLPVHAHNGPWNDGKVPDDDREQLLHLSDYVSAKRILGTPYVIEPAAELEEAFDLKVVPEEQLERLV